MPEIEHRFEFEPSPASLRKWLGTRKAPYDIAGVKYPGYFSTSGYSTDAVWFWLAIAIEMAALVIIVLGGISKGGAFLVGSIIAALLMLVFDYVGSKWAHDQVDEICILRNKLVLVNHIGSKKAISDQISSKAMTGKRIAGYLFIILSALLKIMSLFLLASFDLALILIMTLLYGLVVYVHIVHTGYYLIERALNKNDFPVDFSKWSANYHSGTAGGRAMSEDMLEANQSHARKREWPFRTEVPLNMVNEIIRLGEHHILKGKPGGVEHESIENGVKVYHYTLHTMGVLLDSDIPVLTRGNAGRNADAIAQACVQLQTTYYQG